jgi:molecular chaperone HtpG
LIRSMASALKVKGDSEPVTEAALLLLDQARILDGEVPPDPAGFASRLSRALERGLGQAPQPATAETEGSQRSP